MEFIYDELPKDKVPDDIMHPTSRALFRFWESARGEMAAAKKQDLDLKEIAHILPYLCILERDLHKPAYIWRLAGTGICQLFGKELTGQSVLEDWPDFEKQAMASSFDMVVATMQPAVARFKAVSELGSEIGVEFVSFPIQDSNTGAIQILGATVPFHSPAWLGTQNLVSFELSAMRKIWTDFLPDDRLSPKYHQSLSNNKKSPPFLKIIDGGKKN